MNLFLATVPNALQYSAPAWSPYIAGGGIGLLTWLTFYFSKKPVGASSAYATVAGLIGKSIAPERTSKLKYFRDNPPRVDWELLFVLATIVGGLLAALHGREMSLLALPAMWRDHFGEHSLWLRGLTGLIGGVFMAFGARMAGGCTSGHGISGTAQLNVASWLALICFFIGGVAVANTLFRLP